MNEKTESFIIHTIMGIKQHALFFIILLVSLSITACGKDTGGTVEEIQPDLPNPSLEKSTDIGDNGSESTIIPLVINPLTGLSVADPQHLERRPVMVKVSNFPREGRPHAGLSFADIVFDYYIGHGTNRFLALYYGQDAHKIGPLRSGRRVDAELVTMYNGVLGYGSADEDTDAILVKTLGNYALSHLEAECPAFCGFDTHSATGVFVNSGAVSTFVNEMGWENSKPDLPGMVFNEQPPIDTQPADQVNILFNYYNRAEWRYDPSSRNYLRWIEYIEKEEEEDQRMEMIPLIDRLTGEQLAFSNVVVLFAYYTELAPSAHEIEIWGNDNGLPAYLFRDGMMVSGEWTTPNDSDPIYLTDLDGNPMALKPGNTWFVITGLNSSFDQIQPGHWETFFFLP